MKPDLTTLRKSILSDKGAFVIADPINVDVAPRNFLRQSLSKLKVDPKIALDISISIRKHKQDDDQIQPVDKGLLTAGHSIYSDMATELES